MNILVVDDDATARAALVQVLSPLGGQACAREADSAEAAMQALEAGFLADLVVCDVRMPDTSGIELLERLRQDMRYQGLPVMMITASPDQDVVRQAMQLRVQGFILKPASADALVRARTAMGRFHATLAEDAHQVCNRLACTARQYDGALEAVLDKLSVLVRDLQAWCAADAPAATNPDLPASAALVTRLAPCLNGARVLGLSLLLKSLQSLERLVRLNVEQHDARYTELTQMLALQRQWLSSYQVWRRNPPPQPPSTVAARIDPAAPNPFIRIPPVLR